MPNFKEKFRDDLAIFNKARGEFMKKAAKSIAVVFVVLALCLGAPCGQLGQQHKPCRNSENNKRRNAWNERSY